MDAHAFVVLFLFHFSHYLFPLCVRSCVSVLDIVTCTIFRLWLCVCSPCLVLFFPVLFYACMSFVYASACACEFVSVGQQRGDR